MKNLNRIFFLFSLFIALSNYALAHSVQVAYCVSCNGDLRIFFEHWHGVEDPNSTTMTISLTVNNVTTTQTAPPAGSVQNVPLNSLPGCSSQIISAAACPGQANTYNDWVWFDYTGLPCGTQITFTVVSGNTVFTQDGCGMYPLSVSFTIPCAGGPPPNVTVCQGQPVNVTLPASSTWTNSNPSIGLPASGSGNISFVSTNPGNANISYTSPCGSGTFTITVNPGPVAAFTANNVCLGNPIQFTDQSTGGATTWSWNFGDGNTSTQQSPSHTYTASGTYTVSLNASAPGGCNSTATQVVTVSPQPIANFSSATVCLGTATPFTDLSTGGATSWSWNFGDGNTSTAQNPSNTYSSAGTYTVTLIATGPGGCSSTFSLPVTVYPQPVANFSVITVCQGTATTFTDLSTGGATSWSWNFGDGNTSTSQNPSNTYSSTGTYTATLNVTATPGGCTSTFSLPVTVYAQPVANFSATTVCQGFPTSFTDLSTGGATGWSWAFGDGNTSTVQSPSNTYAASGTYSVTLTTTGTGGCTSTITIPVTVYALPVASFSVNAVCVNTPPTTFTDASSGTTSWAWDFGDPASGANNISSQTNPTHSYSVAGTYTATLIVTSANGCTDTVTQTVTVNPMPTAAFSVTTVCFNNATTYIDQSTGTPTQWQWDFGDGSNSTNQNPTHTYFVDGTYTVTLIATNAFGCADTTSMITVVHPLPFANFTAPAVCVTNQTCFGDASTISSGVVNGWSWNFADSASGINNISNVQSPCHVFTAAGTYNVILTATSNFGCQGTINLPVTVYPPPVAGFTSTDVCLNAITVFSSTSTGAAQWNWTFGDGNSSSAQNPTHTYLGYGTYLVTLIVQSSSSCRDTVTDTVTVHPLPIVNFSADSVCVGVPTTFMDNSFIPIGNIAGWNWNFGDPASGANDTSTAQSPTHVFTAPGTFNVTLTLTSNNNCTSTLSLPVIVFPLPVAGFSAEPAPTVTLSETVEFTDLSTGAVVSWWWDFGDSALASEQNPAHLYTDTGMYVITLIVESNNGCRDTVEQPLRVKDFTFYIPNAFTPNGDGHNDFFFGQGIGIVEYEMFIFDRWGNRIYYCKVSDLPQTLPCMWSGTVDGSSSDVVVQEDVYVWKVKLTNVFMKDFTYTGTVTVVK